MKYMSAQEAKRFFRMGLSTHWGRTEDGRGIIAVCIGKSRDTIEAYAAPANIARTPSAADCWDVWRIGFQRSKFRYSEDAEFVIFDANGDACRYVNDRLVAHVNADIIAGSVGKLDGTADSLDWETREGRASRLRRIFLESSVGIEMMSTIVQLDPYHVVAAMVLYENSIDLVHPHKLYALEHFALSEMGEAA